jgi:hypothetical protein
MPKGKKKGKQAKHGFDSDEEDADAVVPKQADDLVEEEQAVAAKKEKKKGKKAKKGKELSQEESVDGALAKDDVAGVQAEGEEEVEGEVDLGESLVVVEVYEAKPHPKLSAAQQLVTLFDGQDMYKVSTPTQVHIYNGCILLEVAAK